jgi:hypothetical protein
MWVCLLAGEAIKSNRNGPLPENVSRRELELLMPLEHEIIKGQYACGRANRLCVCLLIEQSE